jgi:CRISPR/Cas system-associated endonuclease Cas1
MLNYAYAVLIAQTQIRLIVEGYDPTIRIMHEKKAAAASTLDLPSITWSRCDRS